MNQPAVLQVTDLHVPREGGPAIEGLNLTVERGRVKCLIGPRGSGKSTLLNALMGRIPSRGRIVYAGQDLTHASTEERVLAGLALVPDTRDLVDNLSVLDHLSLGTWRSLRRRRARSASMADRVFTLFPRLYEMRTQKAVELAPAERLMLAIGRALQGTPRLLMLDEPSRGLSTRATRELFNVLNHIHREGLTLLIADHHAEAALSIAADGALLAEGRIALRGTTQELQDDPRVMAACFGVNVDLPMGGSASARGTTAGGAPMPGGRSEAFAPSRPGATAAQGQRAQDAAPRDALDPDQYDDEAWSATQQFIDSRPPEVDHGPDRVGAAPATSAGPQRRLALLRPRRNRAVRGKAEKAEKAAKPASPFKPGKG